jgi:hypothetical protein
MQVSTTLSLTVSSAAAVVGSATGLFVGMYVSHPKVPIGTKINAISGTTITMSNVATANATPSAARFSPLLDAQTPGATGGALAQSTTLATANLPAYTPTTSAISLGSFQGTRNAIGASGNTRIMVSGVANNDEVENYSTYQTAAPSITMSAQGGTSTPFATETVQPTIVVNYIIKR